MIFPLMIVYYEAHMHAMMHVRKHVVKWILRQKVQREVAGGSPNEEAHHNKSTASTWPVFISEL